MDRTGLSTSRVSMNGVGTCLYFEKVSLYGGIEIDIPTYAGRKLLQSNSTTTSGELEGLCV